MWLRKSWVVSIVLVLSLMNTSCAGNIFQNAANETSDTALELDAKRALNTKNWTVAIQKITAMTAAKQAQRDMLYLLASAYGGQCGLAFIAFSSAFGDIGSTALFKFLLEHFVDSDATNQSACELAESTYDQISTDLTIADYLNKTYISFAKIGVILNKINRAESLPAGSNTYDSTNFDPCTEIDDDDTNEIITGFARVVTNASSAGLGGSVPACPGGVDCTKTDTADVTGGERTLFRTLLNGASPGLSGPGGC